MSKKLVIIGGGSSYTPELIEGIINRKSTIGISKIVLVDIESGLERLKIIKDLAIRMLSSSGMEIELTHTCDRADALSNADFVLTQIRVGGMDSRILDEKLPLKYGLIGQETTGAGGFAKALRTVPVVLDICRDIEKYAPKAILINFTNPAGIVTEAIIRYTNVNVLGLCNVPINMESNISELLKVNRDDLYIEFSGLNHMVYGKRVILKGVDITEKVMNLLKNGESVNMNNIPDMKWSSDILDRLNMVPCPYHKYFYMTDDMVSEELEKYEAKGITRGVEVKEIEAQLFVKYKDVSTQGKPVELLKRGGSLYSDAAMSLINSIVNNTGEIHTLNVINNGAIENLDRDIVVEVNCKVYADRVEAVASGKLPESVLGLVKEVKEYEQLTIKAAMEKSYASALKALEVNPLVGCKHAKELLEDIIRENRFELEE